MRTNSGYFYFSSNWNSNRPQHDIFTPYEFPKQKEQYPQIQEGDHGQIIIRQSSLGWREQAIRDIVRQVEDRERQIKCQFQVTGVNLPDGSLLVEWGRFSCEGIPGGSR